MKQIHCEIIMITKNNPVLVVDDNEFIRASMVKFLESNNFKTIGVGNAQAAMDTLNEQAISLVVTDILMPDTDGFELVDYIRSNENIGSSIPIIAISGGGKGINANDLLTSLEEKVDLILKKPFSKKDFINNVATLLKRT